MCREGFPEQLMPDVKTSFLLKGLQDTASQQGPSEHQMPRGVMKHGALGKWKVVQLSGV